MYLKRLDNDALRDHFRTEEILCAAEYTSCSTMDYVAKSMGLRSGLDSDDMILSQNTFKRVLHDRCITVRVWDDAPSLVNTYPS